MKNSGIIAIAALIGLTAWAWTQRDGVLYSKTPTGEAITEIRPELIVETPPNDVRTYQLGGTLYAKFDQPIDVGGGFKQWGVTVSGYPVLSLNPPESYDPAEWF